jgi:hypothetical protein
MGRRVAPPLFMWRITFGRQLPAMRPHCSPRAPPWVLSACLSGLFAIHSALSAVDTRLWAYL